MSIRAERLTVNGSGPHTAARLKEVSFELKDGTVTLLVGAAGAGKSTLLDAVAGLTAADRGSVSIGGKGAEDGKRRRGTRLGLAGIVFQQPERQLFARTVREEFTYSLRPLKLTSAECGARIARALQAMQLPQQLLPENPLRLSGGIKRRVAVAATLAVEPRWLLLDEPTAGLDPESGRRLISELVAWKRRAEAEGRGGIVVATHDLDALLPIADRVLLLAGGRLAADTTTQQLAARPELLLEHGVGWPRGWRLGAALREQGLGLELSQLTPEALADAIWDSRSAGTGSENAPLRSPSTIAEGKPGSAAAVSFVQMPEATGRHGQEGAAPASSTAPALFAAAAPSPLSLPSAPSSASASQLPEEELKHVGESQKTPDDGAMLHRADPRALWGAYALLTAGVLLQQTWLGTLLSLALTAAIIQLAHLPWRPIWRGAKPYLWFTAFAAVLAGVSLTFSGNPWYAPAVGFAWRDAEAALLPLLRLLPALLLGLQLPLVSSHLRMKRGLEWALSRLAWTRLPVEAFALAASLLLRFVPLVLGELERFSRIARARGGSRARPGSLALRDARAVLVPLLLALLQLADDVALALEVRGYRKLGEARTSAVRLCLTRWDGRLLALAALLFALLSLFRIANI